MLELLSFLPSGLHWAKLFFVVGKYRKRAGIKYPQMYADNADAEARPDANRFNCAQRAHQNTLENIPMVWATTLIVGLKMPILAASLCGLWSLSRVSYTLGYVSGDPQKRITPLYGIGSLGVLGLTLTATAQSVCWIWEGVSGQLGF